MFFYIVRTLICTGNVELSIVIFLYNSSRILVVVVIDECGFEQVQVFEYCISFSNLFVVITLCKTGYCLMESTKLCNTIHVTVRPL